MHVLVVDDDPSAFDLAERVLGRRGHTCTAAGDPQSARDAIARGGIDLVLCDVRLGAHDGLELASDLLADSSVAVVMVSGVDEPALAIRALELGAYGYVVKPYRSHDLLINVVNAHRRSELEQAQRRHTQTLEALVSARTRELEAALDRLLAAEQIRDEVIANCSHELRTPLTPVLVWAKRLEQKPDSGPEVVLRCAREIREQGERLLGVVSALLDLSELSRGAGSGGAMIPLERVLAAVSAERPGLDVVVESEAGPIEVSAATVRRVVGRVLDNCAKFAPLSPVRVVATASADSVVISVVDRGPGVSEQDRERVLGAFVQGDGSSTRRVGGLGLGLSVAVADLARVGGRLLLEETPGGGLTVSITLPRVAFA